jgi:hypothetical protein
MQRSQDEVEGSEYSDVVEQEKGISPEKEDPNLEVAIKQFPAGIMSDCSKCHGCRCIFYTMKVKGRGVKSGCGSVPRS